MYIKPSQLNAWELSHSSPVTTNDCKIGCLKCRNSTGMSAVHRELMDCAARSVLHCAGPFTTTADFQG